VAGSGGTQQVFPVSGPELVDFVPPDPIDSILVSTGIFSLENFLKTWDFYRTWLARFGPIPTVNVSTAENSRYPEATPLTLTDLDGNPITSGRVITSLEERAPEWLVEKMGLIEARYTGTFHFTYLSPGGTAIPEKVSYVWADYNYVASQQTGLNGIDLLLYFYYNIDLPVWIAPATVELTDVPFYKPLAYEFEIPPSDLAENLRRAQAWTPYVGTIGLEVEGEAFERKTGSTINLAGGRSAWETMGGLVQGERLDLFSLAHVLNLGLPERLSGSTPVTRLERSSSDSVVLL